MVPELERGQELDGSFQVDFAGETLSSKLFMEHFKSKYEELLTMRVN